MTLNMWMGSFISKRSVQRYHTDSVKKHKSLLLPAGPTLLDFHFINSLQPNVAAALTK